MFCTTKKKNGKINVGGNFKPVIFSFTYLLVVKIAGLLVRFDLVHVLPMKLTSPNAGQNKKKKKSHISQRVVIRGRKEKRERSIYPAESDVF